MTLDEFVSNLAKEFDQHFPNDRIVVCTLSADGDDTRTRSVTNLDADDALDLVRYCFEEGDSEGELDEDHEVEFQIGNPLGRLH